jgi:hypothetical protein
LALRRAAGRRLADRRAGRVLAAQKRTAVGGSEARRAFLAASADSAAEAIGAARGAAVRPGRASRTIRRAVDGVRGLDDDLEVAPAARQADEQEELQERAAAIAHVLSARAVETRSGRGHGPLRDQQGSP